MEEIGGIFLKFFDEASRRQGNGMSQEAVGYPDKSTSL